MRTPDLCLSINRADPGVRSCQLDPVLAGCWGQRGAPRGTPTPGIFKLPASVPDFGSFSPEQPQRWELEIDGLGALSAAWAPLPGREKSREREGGEAGGKEGTLPARTRCGLWRWQSQIFSPRLIPAQNRAPPHFSPHGLLLPAPQSRAPTGSGSCSRGAGSAQPWRAPRSAPGGPAPEDLGVLDVHGGESWGRSSGAEPLWVRAPGPAACAAAGLCCCSSVNQHPAEPGPPAAPRTAARAQPGPAPLMSPRSSEQPPGRALWGFAAAQINSWPSRSPEQRALAHSGRAAPGSAAASCSTARFWVHDEALLRREPSVWHSAPSWHGVGPQWGSGECPQAAEVRQVWQTRGQSHRTDPTWLW